MRGHQARRGRRAATSWSPSAASDVGGTWRDNTYPGAACDVPSQLYSFSFAPNPDWSRSFSPQPEIQAYIQRVAERSGVLDRFRFDDRPSRTPAGTTTRQVWQVRTTARASLTADVAGLGRGRPVGPEAARHRRHRLASHGEVFHSSQWRHDYDLTGKRVAVIGTGASAIQIVPEIAEQVAHLDVYQRTAPHVIPRRDRAYTGAEKLAFKHLPAVQQAYRTAIYWARETLRARPSCGTPRIAAPAKKARAC